MAGAAEPERMSQVMRLANGPFQGRVSSRPVPGASAYRYASHCFAMIRDCGSRPSHRATSDRIAGPPLASWHGGRRAGRPAAAGRPGAAGPGPVVGPHPGSTATVVT